MSWTRKEDGRITCIGHIVDVIGREIIHGELTVVGNRIVSIAERTDIPDEAPYYMPGFIDSHIHIESSMMVPAEFARIAVGHGTVGVIADPHEIANVLGLEGVDFMLGSARRSRFNFFFGAPSCVPSCGPQIETSGARLDSTAVAELMGRDDIWFLGEMMNVPGVLGADDEVMKKIKATIGKGKPVDGHAPGLLGSERMRYASAGISTDHECSTLEEGLSCIESGMMVQIREGSAAKNFEALISLLGTHPESVMFCSDDSHPTDLVRGHINLLVKRAMRKGIDLFDILQATSVNPVRHYHLPVGLLQVGDYADFISTTDISPDFRIRKTYVKGEKVFSSNGYYTTVRMSQASVDSQLSMLWSYPNKFNAQPVTLSDIASPSDNAEKVRAIVASDGSLITGDEVCVKDDSVQKIVVYDRYTPDARPKVAFVKGFNLSGGAMAASIAHDCHNIVAIGCSDEQIVRVLNRVVEMKGGIAATCGDELADLPLPIAGLISPLSGYEIAFHSQVLEETVRRAGCRMGSPFITMAFLALPVIPSLKLTDKGLFDTARFRFV